MRSRNSCSTTCDLTKMTPARVPSHLSSANYPIALVDTPAYHSVPTDKRKKKKKKKKKKHAKKSTRVGRRYRLAAGTRYVFSFPLWSDPHILWAATQILNPAASRGQNVQASSRGISIVANPFLWGRSAVSIASVQLAASKDSGLHYWPPHALGGRSVGAGGNPPFSPATNHVGLHTHCSGNGEECGMS